MDQQATSNTDQDAAAQERSLIDDLRQLAKDGRSFAEAELAYQRSRAAFAGQEARALAGLGVGAAFFLFFALMALTVGALLGLSHELGPWAAMIIVTGVLITLALICALVARSRAKRLVRLIKDDRT